jgi:hypothetical protein
MNNDLELKLIREKRKSMQSIQSAKEKQVEQPTTEQPEKLDTSH